MLVLVSANCGHGIVAAMGRLWWQCPRLVIAGTLVWVKPATASVI